MTRIAELQGARERLCARLADRAGMATGRVSELQMQLRLVTHDLMCAEQAAAKTIEPSDLGWPKGA